MKKLLVIAAAVVLMLSAFAGCGCTETVTGEMNDTPATTTTTTTTTTENRTQNNNGMDNDGIVGNEDVIGGDETDGGILDGDGDGNMLDGAEDGSILDGTDNNNNARNRDSNGNNFRTSSITEDGELTQLASLVGKKDDDVVSALGPGDSKAEISGDTADVQQRKYTFKISDQSVPGVVVYKGDKVHYIELSTQSGGSTIWSLRIMKELGTPERISGDGLDYDYLVCWEVKDNEVRLVEWQDKVTIFLVKP